MNRGILGTLVAASFSALALLPLAACDDDVTNLGLSFDAGAFNPFEAGLGLPGREAGAVPADGSVEVDASPDLGGVDSGVDAGVDSGVDAGHPGCADHKICSNGDGCCPTGCNATNDSDCSPSCGNGLVEPGETCDTTATDGGACPTTCAPNGCQLMTLDKAGTCQAACVAGGSVTACVNGDGCCPAACNTVNDTDCTTPGCGNGVVEKGETCDPLASCPTSCPQQGCNLFTLQNAGTCQTACVPAGQQTACANGDGCCPTGCNANNDNDCKPTCGNGVLEGNETCDPLASCPSTCPQQGCNLRMVQNPGTCEAACAVTGQQSACVNADGCCPTGCNANNDSDCTPTCGNGVLEAGETCDPLASCPTSCTPNVGCQKFGLDQAGTCRAACITAGTISACANDDGCCAAGCDFSNDNDCANPCGNGVVDPGELCDTGIPPNNPGACPTSCTTSGCTKMTLTGSACQTQCASSTITTCGPADNCCPSASDATCNQLGGIQDPDCPAVCGNGFVDNGETCDTASVTRAGACPTCPTPSTPYSCYGTGRGTCTVNCSAPVTVCGENAAAQTDKCCPFATGGACGAAKDADCQGSSWRSVNLGNVDTTNGCVDVVVSVSPGGSYDFTTCGPNKNGVGASPGDTDITRVLDYDTGANYGMDNATCNDPNALPVLAGWYCNDPTGTEKGPVQACASPSPGGFIATGSLIMVTVCPGTRTVCGICKAVIGPTCCPINVAYGGVTPLYAWYNATSTPAQTAPACRTDGQGCGNPTPTCCPGVSCLSSAVTTSAQPCAAGETGCACHTLIF